VKLPAVLLLAALLSSGLSACAAHRPRQSAAKPLRRAPGETADDFAERKAEVREHDREIKEERKLMSEEAKEQSKGFSDPQGTDGFGHAGQ
jgi:hypothetical protein